MLSFNGATIPLIDRLPKILMQVWYTDDACACSSVSALHNWYKYLCDLVPYYGYIVNAAKTWLVVKPPFQAELFAGTGVNLSTEVRPYLGATIGSRDYTQKNVEQKVDECSAEVQRLAKIAESQPHAAYSTLTHSLSSRWRFVRPYPILKLHSNHWRITFTASFCLRFWVFHHQMIHFVTFLLSLLGGVAWESLIHQSSVVRSMLPLLIIHDAVALQYGWPLSQILSHCACGTNFSIKHVLSCHKGSFPSLCHNEIRDLIANLLTEVCHQVHVELELQPVSAPQSFTYQ